MHILVEVVDYFDGERSVQLCGTYEDYEDAQRVMYTLYKDELASDNEYDEDYCHINSNFATCGGEDWFPRVMSWYLFDSDNPKVIW